ncbi:hypothetical protein M0765_014905 [Variovorax sp. S2]|uniref:hypothetical protein n=1 Tax=Variovorax sp. S12S4 TaxID=3029170 RepID=UPI00215C0F25|nr:hypothetical protein [Variovorax sp. S12S4]MCR8958963.1 hypothetical protein [Variovorax sp. S12S4]
MPDDGSADAFGAPCHQGSTAFESDRIPDLERGDAPVAQREHMHQIDLLPRKVALQMHQQLERLARLRQAQGHHSHLVLGVGGPLPICDGDQPRVRLRFVAHDCVRDKNFGQAVQRTSALELKIPGDCEGKLYGHAMPPWL